MGFKAQWQTLEFDCANCGKHTDLEKYQDSRDGIVMLMRQHQICYSCAFWMNFKDHLGNYEVVGGKAYDFGDQVFVVKAHHLAIKLRYIWHFDRTVEKLENCRCIGTVPGHIGIQDTGRFISKQMYKKLSKTKDHLCRAKGCYDRYHCYWYNAEVMEKDGAWNVIPKTHKIGDERCEGFINKDSMFL